ncbi:MAG: FtsX-like permease family protein [Dehalococcoidia bacterium]
MALAAPSSEAVRPRPGWVTRLPFALRTLVRRWRQTIGPTIGVGVSLGVLFSMLALSVAGSRLIYGDFEKSGATTYVLQRGGTMFPLLPGESLGAIDRARPLLAQIRAMPGVGGVIGFAVGTVRHDLGRDADNKRRDEPWQAFGIWGDPAGIPNVLEIEAGRWIERGDEVVVAPRLARLKSVQPGQVLTFNDRRFTVVGIARLRGMGIAGLSGVLFEYEELLATTGAPDVVTLIAVSSSQPENTLEAIGEIRRLDVSSRAQVIEQGKNLASSERVLYNIFSFLALAVAALFVGNVLTMSVKERRIEFATLRAIGISRRTIFSAVMVEALAISLLAYGVGCAIGLGINQVIDRIYLELVGISLLEAFDPIVFVQVFLVDILLGLAAGFLPARAALAVQPVTVLREA